MKKIAIIGHGEIGKSIHFTQYPYKMVEPKLNDNEITAKKVIEPFNPTVFTDFSHAPLSRQQRRKLNRKKK